jgi:hypothetical protein
MVGIYWGCHQKLMISGCEKPHSNWGCSISSWAILKYFETGSIAPFRVSEFWDAPPSFSSKYYLSRFIDRMCTHDMFHNIIYMTWIYLEGYNMLQYVAQWFPIYWVASPPNESWINWDFFFTAQFGKYVPFSTFDAKKKPIVLSVSWFGERIHHLESPSPSQHASKIPQNQHRFSGRGCDEMMKCQTTLRLSVSSF